MKRLTFHHFTSISQGQSERCSTSSQSVDSAHINGFNRETAKDSYFAAVLLSTIFFSMRVFTFL